MESAVDHRNSLTVLLRATAVLACVVLVSVFLAPASEAQQPATPVEWGCAGAEFAEVLPTDTHRNGAAIEPTRDGRGKWVPVLFVHGWVGKATHDSSREGAFSKPIDLTRSRVGSAEARRSLIGQLQTIPGVASFTFDYHDRSGRWVDDEGIGPALGHAIDCLYESSGGEKVIVIAHSMGGLATRFALGSDKARASKVSSVVTYGTPNAGSLAALVAAVGVDAGTKALSLGGTTGVATATVLRVLLASCAESSTISMNDAGICATPYGAFDGEAGKALRVGSRELDRLASWPAGVDVHALAGDARFDITERSWFGVPVKTVQGEPGDLIVTTGSAVEGSTGSDRVKCNYQLNVKQGTRDTVGLLAEVIPLDEVPDQPFASFGGACYHSNLMRTLELSVVTTAVVNDDIVGRIQDLAPTQIVEEVAVNTDGNPAEGYRIVGDSAEVDCYAASIAAIDDGIHRCSPTASGADICYEVGGPNLLCAGSPWDRELRRARSVDPLATVSPPLDGSPWGLELADGTMCRVRNGGAWPGRDDGLNGAYSCDGTNFVLSEHDVPVVDTSRRVWTVRMGGLGESNEWFPEPTVTAVVKAWFAATGKGS
jgi:pimeloyl-ACP methyl ester carboxylesterase